MTEKMKIQWMKSRLSEGAVGCPLFYAESLDSTNEWAKREGENGAADGSVYLADHQTAGKGRRGRVWQSPAGTSLSFSLLLRPGIPLDRYSMLTLVMGMAAADGMARVSGLPVGIKWPNDVVCRGRKLCGILTEMSSRGDYVVIGIGINVNVKEFPPELQETASSLALECGRELMREEVMTEVLESFFSYYEKFRQAGDLSLLQEAYNRLLVSNGEKVRVLDPREPFEGIAQGIDERGQLLVARADRGGEITAVFAGEVSVRGIYGYC